MHILVIPSWYPTPENPIGGSFFREQALALAESGNTIGVVFPRLRSLKRWRPFARGPRGLISSQDHGLETVLFDGTAWVPRVPYATSELWVRRGLKAYRHYVDKHGRPDIIHAHSVLNAGLLAERIRQLDRVPYVVTEHSSAFARGSFGRWQLGLAQKALKSASARIAVSPSLASLLKDLFGDLSWRCIPNLLGDTFEHALPSERPSAIDSSFRFCNVSRLNRTKGLDVLLAAFATAFAGDHTASLVIGGDGPEGPRLLRLARHLGIQEQVSFPGALDQPGVLRLMRESDAYALSSAAETFGVSLIESLATGNPVVATRCGGPESIVRPEDGLLVPKDDPPALAFAMGTLRERYSSYDRAEIRASCMSRFGRRAVVGQLLAVYEEALLAAPPAESR